MKDKVWYGVWAGMFILCAGLGFIPAPTGAGKSLMILLALAFFVPGAVLLYRADRAGSRKGLCRVRNLSAVSLAVTVGMILVNFLSVGASEAAGVVLHVLLGIVSAPMFCAQYWVLSLFCWACLLLTSISCLRKQKK